MSVGEVLEKYTNAIRSDTFIRYEKEFAKRINVALAQDYGLREDNLVEIIENMINGLNGLEMRDNKSFFNLLTRSVFIHGPKSQVKFDYYGEIAQRELGDLIFIISVVYNGQKYFEKLTINQFKKNKRTTRNIFWDIDNKKQLFLLSRFPAFRGVSGIPKKDFMLVNYSGCLGSYGLLYDPGDFAFVSAVDLDSFIEQRNALKMNELHDLVYRSDQTPFFSFYHFVPDINELLYLVDKFYKYSGYNWRFLWSIFGNHHYAHNVYDFAHKYLTVSIGEPVFMKIGIDNPHVRGLLYELLTGLKTQAKRNGMIALSEFTDEFFKYNYARGEGRDNSNENIEYEFDGGGMGIIHTIIDLKE